MVGVLALRTSVAPGTSGMIMRLFLAGYSSGVGSVGAFDKRGVGVRRLCTMGLF